MTPQVPQILVAVRDDPLAQVIIWNMEAAGYTTRRTVSVPDTRHSCRESQPDLIIFDWELMEKADFSTLRSLRDASLAPMLMLVPRSWELDYWELGASDCITKPFSQKEFLGRTKALLRARNL
jgi:two-component system phosphate regulon response regulator PhoB